MTPAQKAKAKLIQQKIDANVRRQKELHNANNDLRYELNKCGKHDAQIVTRGRGKNRRTEKIGRKYWKESFKDEDTGKRVLIERSEIISINGKPCDGFGQLYQYYDLKKK